MKALAIASGAWLALSAPIDPDRAIVTRIDPLTVQDDDFSRHRDPAEWRGLAVSSIEFREERSHWRLWRIANLRHRKGPLFFVPHDNENAGFEAGLALVRRYGGTLIAVDSGVGGNPDGMRMNQAVDYGKPIDPNRFFDSALPGYARRVLADLPGNGLIIALHTNAKGFETGDSRCNRGDPEGQGVISIRYCDDTLIPSPSQSQAYPFDDDDTVAFATFRIGQSPGTAFCRDPMVAADFNVVQERVLTSDGSLSNYAVLHRLKYLNFETLDRGLVPAELGKARDRLLFMAEHAIAMCAPRVKAAGR